jgi:hypothetical protein
VHKYFKEVDGAAMIFLLRNNNWQAEPEFGPDFFFFRGSIIDGCFPHELLEILLLSLVGIDRFFESLLLD